MAIKETVCTRARRPVLGLPYRTRTRTPISIHQSPNALPYLVGEGVLRLDVSRVRLEEEGRDGQQRVVRGVDARLVAEAGRLHLMLIGSWWVDRRIRARVSSQLQHKRESPFIYIPLHTTPPQNNNRETHLLLDLQRQIDEEALGLVLQRGQGEDARLEDAVGLEPHLAVAPHLGHHLVFLGGSWWWWCRCRCGLCVYA